MSKETLQSAIQEKEKKILESKSQTPANPLADLVDESQVEQKIDIIEKKLEASALSPKYKEEIKGRLNETTDEWDKKIKKFKSDSEDKFKELFDNVVKSFEEFEEKPEVKEVLLNIEPLFKNGKEIKDIINLESYGRRSGDFEKINARLNLLGIDGEKIKGIQKILDVTVDGKVGPQTINAINREVYENQIEIKWADTTQHKTEAEEQFNLKAEEAKKIIEGDEWKKVEKETEEKLKEAKTVDDIKKIEEGEMNAKRKIIEAQRKTTPAEVAKVPEEASQAPARDSQAQAEGAQTQPEDDQEQTGDTEPTAETPPSIETPEQNISPEFKELNKLVELSEETLLIYWKAYLESPKQIPIEEIKQRLVTIEEKHLKTVDGETKKRVLIEAFGKLVNGQRDNLVGDNILAGNIESIQEKLTDLQNKLKEASEKSQRFDEVISSGMHRLGKLVEENPLFRFWDPSNATQITKSIGHFKELEKMRDDNRTEIETLEKEFKALLISRYDNEYRLMSNHGENPSELTIALYETLGEEDSPGDVKFFIKDISENDSDLPEFERLLYAGKYAEALESLAKQNQERTKIPGLSGVAGEHDVISSYKKHKSSEAGKKLQEDLKKSGSFAASKIAEGYTPIPAANADGSGLRGVFLVKEQPDGSLSYILVSRDGEELTYQGARGAAKSIGEEHTLSKERITEIETQDLAMQENVEKVLKHSPSIKAVKEASADINKEFASIQTLIQEAADGAKTEDFVGLIQKKAHQIKNSGAIARLRESMPQAELELDKIKALIGTGIADEFEQKIVNMEKAFSGVTHLVSEGGKDGIEAFCNRILSSDFEADTFGRWFVKDAIPFIATILTATAGVVLLCSGVGSGVGGMMISAAVGSLGGIAGHELGTWMSHNLGQAIYGEHSFSNKTLLGKYITGEKILNPETGEMEEIESSELARSYAMQFGVGFITTFVFLGLGKAAGHALTKFIANNGTKDIKDIKGILARILGKIPKLAKHEIDVLEKHGLKELSQRVAKEFLEEMAEEGAEQWAERTHPALGFLVSLYNSLDGRNVEYKLGKFRVVADSTSRNGNEINTTWSYEASKSTDFYAAVTEKYVEHAKAIHHEADGTIIIEEPSTLKDGTVVINKMTFKPTTESGTMRQLFTEKREGSAGTSEIERLYGVKKVPGEDNKYNFENLSPDGEITLVQYLQMQGFVIEGNPTTDKFTAIKGNEKVQFSETKPTVQTDNEVNNPKSPEEAAADKKTDRTAEPDDSEINEIKNLSLKERTSQLISKLWNKTGEKLTDVKEFLSIKESWQKIKSSVKKYSANIYSKIEARIKKIALDLRTKKGITDIFKNDSLIAKEDVFTCSLEFIASLQARASDLGFARKLFGIKGELTTQAIKDGYEYLMLDFHPDRNSENIDIATEMTKIIGAAKATLGQALNAGNLQHVEEAFKPVEKKESVWRKQTVDWINKQVNKISDLQLKEKLGDVVRDIGRFSQDKWSTVVQNWNSIREKVGKFSTNLRNKIDERIQELKKRYEERSRVSQNPAQNPEQNTDATSGNPTYNFSAGEEVFVDIQQSNGLVMRENGWAIQGMTEDGQYVLESNKYPGKQVLVTQEILTKMNPNGGLRAPNRNVDVLNFNEVPRQFDIVAIPDTHGDYNALIGSLEAHGLVDASGNWIGGDSRVQLLGDIFDRGPDSMKILRKIAEFKNQGVQFDLLLGNHEDFVLKAMLTRNGSDVMTWMKYGDAEQRQAIADDKLDEYLYKYRDAIEVLKTSKIVEQVDDVLYMHGEMSDQAANLLRTHGVDGINRIWQQALNKAFEGDSRVLQQVSRDFHPFLWSRAFSGGGMSNSGGQTLTAYNQSNVEGVLSGMGVNLVMHGHTPQSSGRVGRYNIGRVAVFNADIALSQGMSKTTPSHGGVKIGKDSTIIVNDAGTPLRRVSDP